MQNNKQRQAGGPAQWPWQGGPVVAYTGQEVCSCWDILAIGPM